MKTSVKILAIIALVLSTTYTQAQTRFGIKGGLNSATFAISESGVTITPPSRIGFNFGGITEIPLETDFYLQSGLLYSTKGFKINGESLSTDNLEIPINALYKLSVGSIKVLGFAGPYIGYALSGKAGSADIEFSGKNKDMNTFDMGLNFGAGIEISSFQITAQYGLGLTNLAADSNDGTMKNKVFGISVAYLFSGKYLRY